jgi:hypothetical protein
MLQVVGVYLDIRELRQLPVSESLEKHHLGHAKYYKLVSSNQYKGNDGRNQPAGTRKTGYLEER